MFNFICEKKRHSILESLDTVHLHIMCFRMKINKADPGLHVRYLLLSPSSLWYILVRMPTMNLSILCETCSSLHIKQNESFSFMLWGEVYQNHFFDSNLKCCFCEESNNMTNFTALFYIFLSSSLMPLHKIKSNTCICWPTGLRINLNKKEIL